MSLFDLHDYHLRFKKETLDQVLVALVNCGVVVMLVAAAYFFSKIK